MFERGGAFAALATALALAAVLIAAMALVDGAAMTGVHRGEGAFYAVIPHGVMVWVGGLSFGWAILAIAVGVARYWRAIGGGRVTGRALRAALGDAATTRHLDGGGCGDLDDRFSRARRHAHLATM